MKKSEENYIADRPISDKDEDAFQRYDFAKRIAETIINRKSKESIVFGIFGSWGEGKTSIINFIKKEVEKGGNKYVQITFNPWRFTDEAALLTSFFNTLAKEVKKVVPENQEIFQKNGKKPNWFQRQKKGWESRKEPLKTNTEAIGELIQKYGKLAAIFGAGEVAETIGKAISDVDIETLKERIENLLEEHKKRIIIYIDDIDRLDKAEIHSIFRLVKLTGDFSFTNYVLSFDEEMVASAIGERFGSGDKKAGENFLEKIIQVPLTIPKAQPDALKKFCFQLVDNAVIVNKIALSEEEAQRFVYQFTTNILSRLTTPRLAVRYGNTLSFTLPLLKGEVNIVDQMLIEALKIFYPKHYQFVKENPDYFIGSYSNQFSHGNDNEKIDAIKEHLRRLESELNENESIKVKDLLSNLFPRLDTAFVNYHFSSESYNEWYLNKRIVSPKYFNRYFSYVVLEGDISDVEFKSFLDLVKQTNEVKKIANRMIQIIEGTTASNFIHKLRSLETEFDWSDSKKIAKAICDISEALPKEGGIMSMGFETPFGQASIFIYQLFKNNSSEQDLFDFAKELMIYPENFNFAYGINNWLRKGERKEDKLFNENEYEELAKVLTDRAKEESGEDSIYEIFPEYIGYIGHTWAARNKGEFDDYTEYYLNKKKENIITLIKAYVPTVRSTAKSNPYKGDLTKDRYEILVSYHNKEDLYTRIQNIVDIGKLKEGKPYWNDFGDKDFTYENMFRQFLHWYTMEKGNEEKEKKNEENSR